MYKQILRRVDMFLHWLLVYILVVSWFILCMWQYCIWQSVDAIRTNPGFAERLGGYAELVQHWGTVTDAITLVKPWIKTTEAFKSADWWNKAVEIANAVQPGTGTVIELLDTSVGKTVEVKQHLLSLSQIASSATTVEQYLTEPTPHLQQELYDAFAGNIKDINQLAGNLETVTSLISTTTNSIAVVTKWLKNTSANGNFWTSSIAEPIYQVVVPLDRESSNFANALTEFKMRFARDAMTINTIVYNTEWVEWGLFLLAPGILRPLVVFVSEHIWRTLLLVVIYLSLRIVISQKYEQLL